MNRIAPQPEMIHPFEEYCHFMRKFIHHWEIRAMEFGDFVQYYRFYNYNMSWFMHGDKRMFQVTLDWIDQLVFDMGELCFEHVPENEVDDNRIATAKAYIEDLAKVQVRNPYLPYY